MGYGNDFGVMEESMDMFGDVAMGAAGFLVVFFLLFYLLMLTYAIVCYVLQAAGMYTVAKRRGIRHPWLTWLPLGNMWILGSVSDQYQYVAKGKVRNRRKVLLGLTIAIYCIWAYMMVFSVLATLGLVGGAPGREGVLAFAGVLYAAAILGYIAMIILAIILMVFQYIVLYDVYDSCNPDNAVLFLILSIFLGITPFFIFFNRKKDLGMPPRKEPETPPVIEAATEPEAEPVAQPEEPIAEETE